MSSVPGDAGLPDIQAGAGAQDIPGLINQRLQPMPEIDR